MMTKLSIPSQDAPIMIVELRYWRSPIIAFLAYGIILDGVLPLADTEKVINIHPNGPSHD